MSTQDQETDDELASDVLPEVVAEPAVPVKLDRLFPWHRPRKQFVRECQWVALSKRLAEKLNNSNSLPLGAGGKPEIRYLTLPGIDYLDVQLLGKACAELGCDLTTTGYLGGDATNSIKARAEFRQESLIKSGIITDNSHTFWRRIEDISSTNSNAYFDLRNRSPFHIVNIDACGSPAPPTQDHANRLVDAIYRIVELQLSRTASSWMLFLTTDVRKENFNASTLQKLSNAIRSNASKLEEFKQGAHTLLAQDADDVGAAIDLASDNDGEAFLRLYSLGMAKWLLHLANEKNWGLKMHNSYFYSTAPHPQDRPTMPCLAFEFAPPPASLSDPFAVTNASPAPSSNYSNLSMRAISKVRDMVDLDERLSGEQNLRAALLARTRQLLLDAGYATSALEDLENLA